MRLVQTLLLSTVLAAALALQVRQSVVFRKINDVTITRSQWRISFVVDLQIYTDVTRAFLEALTEVQIQISTAIREVGRQFPGNHGKYQVHLVSMIEELNLLNYSRLALEETFLDYRGLKRPKRSIIPWVGSVLSTMFGTASEGDLDDIRDNLQQLQDNQDKMTHVIEKGLTLLNISRTEISENRNRINQISGLLRRVTDEINTIGTRIHQAETFLHIYASLQGTMARVRGFLREIDVIFWNFKMQIDFLVQGRLNPTVIPSSKLRNILLTIEKKLPNSMYLPANPNKALLDYYKFLTCTSTVVNDKIVIIIRVPLLDVNGRFEIYKVVNLPMPFIKPTIEPPTTPAKTEGTSLSAIYTLEANAIAISTDRTKYALVDDDTIHECSRPRLGFCALRHATYPVNTAQTCMSALFMNNKIKAQKYCGRTVIPSSIFPKAYYIAGGVWMVVLTQPLTFTVLCHSNGREIDSLRTLTPPVGIISLNQSCTATSESLNLPHITR